MSWLPIRVLVVALSAMLASGAEEVCADEKPKAEGRKKEKEQKGKALFDGKTLKGWRVVEKFVFEDHGKVKVKDGAIRMETGKPGTGIAIKGKFPKVNYEVSLEAMRTEGDDFFCGLTFPVGKSPCTLIVGGWGGGVTGLSNVDEMSAVENETTDYVEFKNGRWYKIRLRVTDEKIQAWIDEKPIVDLATKDRRFSVWWEQEPVKPFGIATWRTGAAVRNIRLREVPKPEK